MKSYKKCVYDFVYNLRKNICLYYLYLKPNFLSKINNAISCFPFKFNCYFI